MEEWSLDLINSYCQEHLEGSVACEMTEGQGRIMVARKDVPQGEVLFIEPLLHVVQEDEANEAFVAIRDLSEESPDDFDYEPLWYWTGLCSLTEQQVKKGPKIGSLPNITEDQQRKILCLYHDPVEEASDAVLSIIRRLGLKVDPLLVEELLQAWILNCFEHTEDPQGYSVYFVSSFANHSCSPNAIWAEGDNGDHVLRAREKISVGDEVTITYLEENVLLHSAEARKRVLQDTKLFECTCPRCAPDSSGGDSLGVDMCRGFYCSKCGKCAIFHPLRWSTEGKGKSKGKGKMQALRGIQCSACGAVVDVNEGKRLLQKESDLDTKLRHLGQQIEEKGLGQVMDQDRARSLLRLVANEKDGPIGPQHFLCEQLWEHLQDWYGLQGRREDQRRMLQLRVDYQKKAYPGLNAALAWTLERQAEIAMRHLGFGSKMLDSDLKNEEEMKALVRPTYEESMRILGLMFGKTHEHYTQVERKYRLALKFLERYATKSQDKVTDAVET